MGLPSYAFERRRFWLGERHRQADTASLGLSATGHPLLGAGVEVAGGGEVLFTGRLSVRTHPWLAEHRVAGRVVVPGAVLVESVVRAGDEFGATVVEELSVVAPLVLPEQGGVLVQVRVGEADEEGSRPVTVHSRPESRDSADWTLTARGTVGAAAPEPVPDLAQWPPPGAVPVGPAAPEEDEEDGSAPRTRTWTDGEALLVEAELPAGLHEDASSYVLHPVLLEAVRRTAAEAGTATGDDTWSAQEWTGVRFTASGAVAVRARLTRTDKGLSAVLHDRAGGPVAVVDSLPPLLPAADRPGPGNPRGHDALFSLGWSHRPLPSHVRTPRWALLPAPSATPGTMAGLPDAEPFADVAQIAAGDTVPDLVLLPVPPVDGIGTADRVRALVHGTLDVLRSWLAEDALADARLVVVTSGAVGDTVTDPGAAAVWGLLRSAQSEAPERFVLVDTDGGPASAEALPAAVASGEPQILLRSGTARVPRVGQVPPDTGRAPVPATWDTRGTVLVTGGTGALGALVARHLVAEHGVGHLLLLSRRGEQAPEAAALRAELEGMGGTVDIAACDVADRDSLAKALAQISGDHPLTGVVHTAGVLDDGVLTGLTPEQVDRVLRPKVDAAWNLHELTLGADLTAFVLFSSIAGVIGGPGQANYAAANAFLDSLARHRADRGLAATSLAWGLWKQETGMTGHLGEIDLNRIARAGFRPVRSEDGTAMLDAALALGEPALVAAPMDLSVLREHPDRIPLVLTGLARRTVRHAARNAESGRRRLAALLQGRAEHEQLRIVLDAVRTEVAEVLGHTDPGALASSSPFPELGFDSLTSVELRNRLESAAGLRLAPTVVFDHPTPGDLAAYLRTRLVETSSRADGPTRAAVDFAAEIHLPDDIRPRGGAVPVDGEPREVLLTGATGFLGAFLLRDLMRTTRARIHCLVRGADEAAASERLRENLRWYRVWDEVDPDRLQVVPGDLAAPLLGLGEERFDALSATVDAVYHAGAAVNWLLPYGELRAVNVGGVREVLRLATRHRTVPVHHVSTTGVFSPEPATEAVGRDLPSVRTTDRTGPGEALPTGYVQSKWVAEQVIGLARERGVPVTVYRVDVISGDQVNGACQTRDFVWLSLRGLLQAGCVPRSLTGEVHLTPVDYAGAAIVHLSRDPRSRGRDFHLYNRAGVGFAELVHRLGERGYRLEELDRGTWRERVRADRGNAMNPLLDSFELMAVDSTVRFPGFDTSETDEVLSGAGIRCPEPTADLIDKYVDFFVGTGYFPPVPEPGA
ncbi:thioester reductase domain-containing protein [Nocardiopsis sp. NPDC058631]|uniref:thioester reductase domain-containing protein n=1 Tax=Nocardiopsis sp. NPDC058631 TaxID=3346566 RepID=UPI00365EF112